MGRRMAIRADSLFALLLLFTSYLPCWWRCQVPIFRKPSSQGVHLEASTFVRAGGQYFRSYWLPLPFGAEQGANDLYELDSPGH